MFYNFKNTVIFLSKNTMKTSFISKMFYNFKNTSILLSKNTIKTSFISKTVL